MSYIPFILILTIFSLLTIAQNCPNGVLYRKEVRQLTSVEWNTFTQAYYKIRNSTRPTWYDEFVTVHNTYNLQIHSRAMFLPWHRRYLLELERRLQTVNANITLPYWAWSYDASAPERSPVLSSRYYGVGGSSSNNYCVQGGAFSGLRTYYPRFECLTRGYNRGDRIGAFYSPEMINRIITSNRDFEPFRYDLEVNAHNTIHSNIGRGFATMFAPNDPLFMAHHAYVDLVWAKWQKNWPRSYPYYGRNQDGSEARDTDRMYGFRENVRSVLDTTALCYQYTDYNPRMAQDGVVPVGVDEHRSVQKPLIVDGGDRLDLISLRIPDPLPEDYILARGLRVKQVRASEKKHADAIQSINEIKGYMSPAALFNQPNVLKDLLVHDEQVKRAIQNVIMTNVTLDQQVMQWKQATVAQYAFPLLFPSSKWQRALESIIGQWVLE